MGWLEGVWDGNSMLKCQHTYADFPAVKIPNADISAHMLEKQHNEYYKLKNCPECICQNRLMYLSKLKNPSDPLLFTQSTSSIILSTPDKSLMPHASMKLSKYLSGLPNVFV